MIDPCSYNARIAAFIPGASPPDVRTPIFVTLFTIAVLKVKRKNKQLFEFY
jgi:hypothetical protein